LNRRHDPTGLTLTADSKINKGECIMKKAILSYIYILLAIYPAILTGAVQPLKMERAAVSNTPHDMVIGHLASLSIDPRGNVFAFAKCGKECFIIKFSPTLEYIKHFGGEGKGPAEFTTFLQSIDDRISIDDRGNVYVNDGNPCRIILFDNDGKYLDKEFYFGRLGFKSVNTPMIIAKGKYTAFSYNTERMDLDAVLLTLEPPQVKALYSFDEKRIRTEDGASLGGTYYGVKFIHDMDDKHLVFGSAQSFKFYVFDKNGNLIVKVDDKKRTENSFSPEEIEELKKEMCNSAEGKEIFKRYYKKIIGSKHFIHSIKIDGERIYVFTVENTTVKDKYPVEIYNLKGKLVKKGTMPNRPDKIYKSFVYFLERDSEDNPLIVKYKLLD
jgi:outer membrane protein assembly factor BamB